MVDLVLDRVLTSTQLEKIFVQVCEARTLGAPPTCAIACAHHRVTEIGVTAG